MLEFKDFGLDYEDFDKKRYKILENVNISFEKGSVSVITGESGSGKSSIIKAINGIIPEIDKAKLSGKIELDGKNLVDMTIADRSKFISTVFQNPKNQFYAVNSLDEIAFALENRNIKRDEIFQTINKYSKLLGTEKLLDKDLLKLSGGEKQLVAITSVAVLDNDIYVFDEPSASLDKKAIEKLARIIKSLKDMGKIIIIAEHRLYYLKNIIDKLCIIKDNKLIEYGKNKVNNDLIKTYNLRRLDEIGINEIKNGKWFKKSLYDKLYDNNNELRCIDFYCKYKNSKEVLFDFNISFDPGIYFIIGENGIGKTSFIRNLCKLNKGQKSLVYYKGKKIKSSGDFISLVMQDVNYQLFTESVYKEISIVTDDEKIKEESLTKLGLIDKKNMHPQSLSGGQKQRLALALAYASPKKIVILDEPTSGLCMKNMKKTIEIIREMKNMGKIVIIVTHDYEFIKMVDENVVEFVNGS